MGSRCFMCGGRVGDEGLGSHPQKGKADKGLIAASEELLSLGRDLTSVLGLAQPHLSDLPTPGLQLRVPSHDIIPVVEEVDNPLHIPAHRRRELSSLRVEGCGFSPLLLFCGL